MNITLVKQSNTVQRLGTSAFFFSGMAVTALAAFLLQGVLIPSPQIYVHAPEVTGGATAPAAVPDMALSYWNAAPGLTAVADTSTYVEGPASLCLELPRDFTGGNIASTCYTASTAAREGQLSFWIKADITSAPGSLAVLNNGIRQAVPAAVLDGKWHLLALPVSRGDITLAAYGHAGASIWLDGLELNAVPGSVQLPDAKARAVNSLNKDTYTG